MIRYSLFSEKTRHCMRILLFGIMYRIVCSLLPNKCRIAFLHCSIRQYLNYYCFYPVHKIQAFYFALNVSSYALIFYWNISEIFEHFHFVFHFEMLLAFISRYFMRRDKNQVTNEISWGKYSKNFLNRRFKGLSMQQHSKYLRYVQHWSDESIRVWNVAR